MTANFWIVLRTRNFQIALVTVPRRARIHTSIPKTNTVYGIVVRVVFARMGHSSMKVDVVLVCVKKNVHAVTTEKLTCQMRCYNANQSDGRETKLFLSFCA